jgi:phosphonate degradation associated HDIG domain protein
MSRNAIESVAAELVALYQKYGDEDYIGEPVSQMQHMSQAAVLAIEAAADDEVVLAAFFHDIGHICVAHNKDIDMEGYGNMLHEKIGADFIRAKGFPEKIAALIENHVQAKRYLTFKYPDYYQQLSKASRKTLEVQGGVMTAAEAGKFEEDPYFEVSIKLRRWDDAAKEEHKPINDMELIKSRIITVLSSGK